MRRTAWWEITVGAAVLGLIAVCVLLAVSSAGAQTSTVTVTQIRTVQIPPLQLPPFCASQDLHNALMQCKGQVAVSEPPAPSKFGALPSGASIINGTDTYGSATNVASSSDTRGDISYVSGVAGKDWTAGGLAVWHHYGKGTGIVFEQGAAQATEGCIRGAEDADLALRISNSLGAPSYAVIHAAVDSGVSGLSVKPYFICWEHVLGPERAGDYGSYFVVRDLNEWGIITNRASWQTRAWSQGLIDTHACSYQWAIPPMGGTEINGTGVDRDVFRCPDWGQFPYAQRPPVNPEHYNYLPDHVLKFHAVGASKQLCNPKHHVAHCHLVKVRERLAAKTFDHTGCLLDKHTHHFKRRACKILAQHLRLAGARIYFIAHHTANLRHKVKHPRWAAKHWKYKNHVTTLGGGYRAMRRRYTATAPVKSWG